MYQTQIIISGGGPVGMTLALDLARHGVRSLIVERNPTTTRHPKMDITNARSMELFRALDLHERLREVAVPPSNSFDVSWVTNFLGHELHRFEYPSVNQMRAQIAQQNDGSQPLEPAMRVSQVEIEPVLRTAIEENELIDMRFSTRFERFEETSEGVRVVLRDMVNGEEWQAEGQYLAGCDGGGSQVRAQLGIGWDGRAQVFRRYMTHFRSSEKDFLEKWGVAWHYQSAQGTLIAQNDKDIWTLHSPCPDDVQDLDPRAFLRAFFGRDIEAEILVSNAWTPHLLVAQSYQRGRVFLAGDAAHQYIPTGGYGMNTGIGDATNLGWKLAAAVLGYGDQALLDSYESERLPIGRRNCNAAEANANVRREIAALYGDALYVEGAGGDAARAEIAAKIATLGNLENEAWGIEYGYNYAGSNVVLSEAGAELSDDPAVYKPSTVPGVRLPSVFLPDGTALYDKLDRWFTLLAFADNPAIAAFEAEAAARDLPLKVVRIDAEDLAKIYEMPLLLVRPDHHVAWRGADVADAGRVLDQAFGRL